MKKTIGKYYWVIAGLIVGLFSIMFSYINLRLIIDIYNKEADLNYTGVAVVILEYIVLVYLLSKGQRLFNNKRR